MLCFSGVSLLLEVAISCSVEPDNELLFELIEDENEAIKEGDMLQRIDILLNVTNFCWQSGYLAIHRMLLLNHIILYVLNRPFTNARSSEK